MISSLKGRINRIWGSNCEIDVGGVGYLIYVGKNFIKNRTEGEETKVYTYLAVSENDMSLYGFESLEEVDLFKMLISVSGVGPKTGAQILGGCNCSELVKAIGDANVEFFQNIKGIGKKTAQRIIIDLKSKIGGLGELDLSKENQIIDDDLTASLKQLGFDRKEIDRVTGKLPKDLIEIEERLGWCLQNL